MSIRPVFDAGLLLLSLLTAIPAMVLLVEIAAAVSRKIGNDPQDRTLDRTERVAVLMPAHDEAAGIAAAIAALSPQLGARDRLLVVADNCTDDTAAIARAAHAEVIERRDPQRRGKGYALDFGMRWLERDPPDLVVMVDADCLAAGQSLDRLARACVETGRPVQALYLMHAPAGASLSQRIAAFAWLVKNKLRPLGAAALGWPCQLMGTGMAFLWPTAHSARLASSHLVEDMQLGLDLAAAGVAPHFCPGALVTSTFPVDRQGTRSQRMRWEQGHLSVIASVGPRLMARAVVRRDVRLAGMVLDLMVPPLAALVLCIAVLAGIDLAWWAVGGSGWPLAVSAVAFGLLGVGVVLAWLREGRSLVSLPELLGLPFYAAAKIPLYFRMLTRRQVEWVRTKRNDRSP